MHRLAIRLLSAVIFILIYSISTWATPCQEMLTGNVYHASHMTGLKELEPRVSTHGKAWVYATKYLGMVAAYLASWSDFDFAQGSIHGRIYLVERYPGAFKKIFQNKTGSIYTVSSNGFLAGQTGFHPEVINPKSVPVINEHVVEDAWAFIQKVSLDGELDLYFYPDRPEGVPHDDSDIVEKAAKWSRRGQSAYDAFVELHPHLKSALDKKLSKQ